VNVLQELEPVVGRLLDRHIANAKEWFPHELVPWSRGRDFEPGEPFDPAAAPMDDALRSALVVNLLTEDNLPHYFETIHGMFGSGGDAWRAWARRWTAEEGRHAIAIRDYLTVSRMVDPIALERGRMQQVSRGEVPRPETPIDGMVYVTLQELATRLSHGNTGRMMDDPWGRKVMARVAGDEQLHHVFYRDLVTSLLELAPDETVLAIDRNVRGFAMPGTGIDNFADHAKAIARAGIYDFAVHHDSILQPIVVEHWDLPHIEGLSPEADEARARCLKYIEKVGKAGRRMASRRAESTPQPVPA
jgi:acyl-[acyl-carrier-protein] desaturase